MKEQIVTGKKFRILADVTSRLWHVISFWTKAQDVEFNDGTNAQSKLGNIVGISDSLTSTASNVAASAKAVKVLNDKVVNQIGNLNGQISQKDQTINNLNNTISNLNGQIDNLTNQIENSIKIENVIEYVSLSRGQGPVTCTKQAYVSVEGSRQITNHDNSSEGHIAIAVVKNGVVLDWQKTFISEFSSGRRVSISWEGTANAGDVIEIQTKDLNEQGGSTWDNPDPEQGKDHIRSYSEVVNKDIVVINSK